MEEKEIHALASEYIPNYRGVFAIDKIPLPKPNKKNAYIINILHSESQEKIGHWIALIINKKDIYIMDPAGKYAVRNKHMINYIKKIGVPVTTNFIQLQPKNSWYCGIYVLNFLYHKLVLKKSFISFINQVRDKINPDKHVCIN